MKNAPILVLMLLALSAPAGVNHKSLSTNHYTATTPIESRILHLRAGNLINNAIMNGSSFAFALV